MEILRIVGLGQDLVCGVNAVNIAYICAQYGCASLGRLFESLIYNSIDNNIILSYAIGEYLVAILTDDD